jgi:tetratricopeptide (TPR) repeat protein/DNA-binding SARP family transcriptional activator
VEPRFTILGNTGIRVGDEIRNQLGHTKLRGILGVLLLNAGEFVSIDYLVEWVWPDGRLPQDRASTCYTYIKRIREVLKAAGLENRIDTDDGAYRIRVDRREIDFFAFRDVVERARVVGQRGDSAKACREIEAALGLWTARPLADAQGERAAQWRMWARQQHWIDAYGALTYGLLALGEYQLVIRRLDDLPVEYQSNLTLVKRRLQALHELGRPRDRTTYYLKMRKFFRVELDQDEADDLSRFYELLLKRERGGSVAGGVGGRGEVAPHAPRLLPHDIADFTGREKLIEQLDSLTTSPTGEGLARLVVLEGAPGVGKTAIATRWAHLAADRFPGGQLYIDLQGFAEGPKIEAAEIVDRMLAAFDFPLERVPIGVARFSKLANLLSGRRALIILDNAEESRHVQPLLDYLSTCTVLVTSRQRLSKLARRGAALLLVSSLDQCESVEWLKKRIGARAEADGDFVQDIATLCGGNSLSLCVVAEHIVAHPGVPLAEFVDELRAEHALLDLGDDGDGPAASIRASFSYSLQKLGDHECRVFRLLSVNPSAEIGLGVAAALAACDLNSVRRALDGLLHAHLVFQGESRDRYQMHDLLRQYAATLMSSHEREGERRAAEERMLSFYLHSASNADRTIFPHRTLVPLEPLAPGVEPEHFRDDSSAVNWFAKERAVLGPLVHFAADRGYGEYVVKLSSCIGEAAQRLGNYGDVIDVLGLALRAARSSGDHLGEAYSLNNLGFTCLNQRRFDLAESYLRDAQRKFGEVGMPEGVAGATFNIGRVLVERGEVRQGIEHHLAALATFRDIGAQGPEVISLYRLGEAHRIARNFEASISFLRDALWLAERLGDQRSQAFSLAELAAVYAEQGDYSSAEGYGQRALAVSESLADTPLAAKAGAVLARIARDERSFVKAVRYAQWAAELYVQVRDARGEATANHVLASAQYALGEREEATHAWHRALVVLEDLGDPLADVVRLRLTDAVASLPAGPPAQARTEASGITPPRAAAEGSPESA